VKITGPGLAYEYVYDPALVDLKKIAYDFEYELDDWSVDPHLFQELVALVQEWQRRYASADKPFLYFSKTMTYATVYDGRNPDAPTRERFDWPESQIIEMCNEAPKSGESIRQTLQAQVHEQKEVDRLVDAALTKLTAKRILYEERAKYFTLAVPENQYY
jgi:hypothetical protein